jgi:hypothetical protein
MQGMFRIYKISIFYQKTLKPRLAVLKPADLYLSKTACVWHAQYTQTLNGGCDIEI